MRMLLLSTFLLLSNSYASDDLKVTAINSVNPEISNSELKLKLEMVIEANAHEKFESIARDLTYIRLNSLELEPIDLQFNLHQSIKDQIDQLVLEKMGIEGGTGGGG